MRNDCPGFSLIEMAIVLIILGILATVLIPPLVSSVKYEKRAENKDALNALKLSIIGYAKANTNNTLPASLTGAVGDTNDVWGREYKYRRGVNGTICDAGSDAGVSLTTNDNRTVNGTAFIVASRSRHISAGEDANYTSWDFSGDDHDDIYEYVTLYQLKYLLGCTK